MVYIWSFRRFPDRGIDPKHMRILLFLKNNGPHTSREIARTLGYTLRFTQRSLQLLRRIGAVEVHLQPGRGLEDYV